MPWSERVVGARLSEPLLAFSAAHNRALGSHRICATYAANLFVCQLLHFVNYFAEDHSAMGKLALRVRCQAVLALAMPSDRVSSWFTIWRYQNRATDCIEPGCDAQSLGYAVMALAECVSQSRCQAVSTKSSIWLTERNRRSSWISIQRYACGG